MVMFSLSLRAVLRKESWMFCAGLLVSISRSPLVLNLRSPKYKSAARPHFCVRGTRGDNLPPRRPVSWACAAWQVAASTIRRPLALFNLELAEIDLSLIMREDAVHFQLCSL